MPRPLHTGRARLCSGRWAGVLPHNGAAVGVAVAAGVHGVWVLILHSGRAMTLRFEITCEDPGTASPAQHCHAIANRHSGNGSDEAFGPSLAALLARNGFSGTLELVEGEGLAEVLERLPQRPPLILVGGGDGTMRTVARAVAGTPHTLGTLPLGTINLFARTLGIPLDLGEAVAALAAGVDRKVDVAEVNGEIFVNNCTFGVYADLVRHRAARRTRRGRHSKIVRWTLDTGASLVRAVAAWRVLRVRIGAERRARRVPLVIVSNNEYRDGPPFSRLDSHRLAVYTPRGSRAPRTSSPTGRSTARCSVR